MAMTHKAWPKSLNALLFYYSITGSFPWCNLPWGFSPLKSAGVSFPWFFLQNPKIIARCNGANKLTFSNNSFRFYYNHHLTKSSSNRLHFFEKKIIV